jgi:hypothetical protein
MEKPTWKNINGKTIKYRLFDGTVIEALVIANPEIGITIKPVDASEVTSPDEYQLRPTDPDFFLVCTDSGEGVWPFGDWVHILSKDAEVFTEEMLGGGYEFSDGTCPFSS